MAKTQTTNPNPKLIFVVSDLHSGGTGGLLPPGFRTFDGNEVRQNPGQAWLWGLWLKAIEWAKQKANGDPFVVVVNGDLIEGVHHRNTQIISAEPADHIEAAKQCMEPLVEGASKVFIIQGTECHTGGSDAGLGGLLRGEENPETGKRSFVRLELDVGGTLCVFRHHIGTTSRSWLEASQMSIHMREEQIQASRKGSKCPQVLVCSHRHKFGYWGDPNALVVVTPCWQIPTRYAHKVVPNPVIEPGIVSLDWRGLADGSMPVMDWKVFEPRKEKPVKLYA